MPAAKSAKAPRRAVVVRLLPTDKLVPTADNTRRPITNTSVESLAKSLVRDGVLQPIVVRPHPSEDGKWEIRAGERRWRAAKLAGLAEIPAIIRPLDDQAAMTVTIAENLQRENLHPLEEAAAFRQALDKGLEPKALAAKLGKSAAFVHRRASLTTLSQSWRAEILRPDSEAGRFSVAHLELISRLPAETQELLAENGFHRVFARGFPTVEELRRVIDDGLRTLASMPWKLDDEGLDPKAGACLTCPKRSGMQPALFDAEDAPSNGKVSKSDRCLDPCCFDRKMTAFVLGREAVARGEPLLDEAKQRAAARLVHAARTVLARLPDELCHDVHGAAPEPQRPRGHAPGTGDQTESLTRAALLRDLMSFARLVVFAVIAGAVVVGAVKLPGLLAETPADVQARQQREQAKREAAARKEADNATRADIGVLVEQARNAETTAKEFVKETERFAAEVEPLLTSDPGKLIAADPTSVETIVALLDRSRPTKEDASRLAQRINRDLVAPLAASLKQNPPLRPDPSRATQIESAAAEARSGVAAYRELRLAFEALLAEGKKSGGTPADKTLAAVIEEARHKHFLEQQQAIQAASQELRDASAAQLVQAERAKAQAAARVEEEKQRAAAAAAEREAQRVIRLSASSMVCCPRSMRTRRTATPSSVPGEVHSPTVSLTPSATSSRTLNPGMVAPFCPLAAGPW